MQLRRIAVVMSAIFSLVLTPHLALGGSREFFVGTKGSAKAEEPPGCQKQVAVDYLRPLSRLPVVHRPPEGRLGVAPRVELNPVANDLVQVSGGYFGYGFSVQDPSREWAPHWRVKAEITRVNTKGEDGPVLDEKRRVLERVRDSDELGFALPLRFGNGVFRYTIEIERLNGHHLATFEQYVRVVPRHFAAEGWLDAMQYQPGDSLYLQVRNFGSLRLTFAEGGQFEVFNGSAWVRAGFQFPGRRFKGRTRNIRRRVVLYAGQASGCSLVPLPSDAPPGKYRVNVAVSTAYAERPRHLYAPFEID